MKKKVSVLAIDSTELMMALEELEKDKGIKKEAILYLESWTPSEQRINVGEKTVNVFFAPYKDESNYGRTNR